VKSAEAAEATVLDEAARVTSGARPARYGHPAENHGCTAGLWTSYLVRRLEKALEIVQDAEQRRLLQTAVQVAFRLDSRDVCWMNILQKASRDANARVRDNLVDVCGYARNAEMIEERQAEISRKQGDSEAV
jgi:hypothetical protein